MPFIYLVYFLNRPLTVTDKHTNLFFCFHYLIMGHCYGCLMFSIAENASLGMNIPFYKGIPQSSIVIKK